MIMDGRRIPARLGWRALLADIQAADLGALAPVGVPVGSVARAVGTGVTADFATGDIALTVRFMIDGVSGDWLTVLT